MQFFFNFWNFKAESSILTETAWYTSIADDYCLLFDNMEEFIGIKSLIGSP